MILIKLKTSIKLNDRTNKKQIKLPSLVSVVFSWDKIQAEYEN